MNQPAAVRTPGLRFSRPSGTLARSPIQPAIGTLRPESDSACHRNPPPGSARTRPKRHCRGWRMSVPDYRPSRPGWILALPGASFTGRLASRWRFRAHSSGSRTIPARASRWRSVRIRPGVSRADGATRPVARPQPALLAREPESGMSITGLVRADNYYRQIECVGADGY